MWIVYILPCFLPARRYASAGNSDRHRCDKRLQRLQKILCKRVYYFVDVYLNKNHMSETKQNYDGKPSYCVRIGHWLTSFGHVASDGKQLPHDGAPPTQQTSRLEDV